MNNARIMTVASVALCAIGLHAAVPGAPNPTWWGVINNHLEVRFANDNGVTKTYRAYVRHPGESTFSMLGNVTCTGGTGGHRADRLVTDYLRQMRMTGRAVRTAVVTNDKTFGRAAQTMGADVRNVKEFTDGL